MDFISALDIIIKDLKEAREILDDLKNYPDVPRFQLELAMSKCKSAEEVLSLLKTFEPAPVKATTAEEETGDTTVLQVEEPEPVKTEEQMPPAEKTEPDNPEIQETRPSGEDLTEKKTRPEKKGQPIFADTFGKTSSIINEHLGTRKRDDDISSAVKSKPVGNLKDAIGLNDKFLYIRELFDGNPSRYEEALTRLNEIHDLDEARSIVFSLVDNDEENEVALQLLDLLKRKLSSDG